jgi:hypothetical protein
VAFTNHRQLLGALLALLGAARAQSPTKCPDYVSAGGEAARWLLARCGCYVFSCVCCACACLCAAFVCFCCAFSRFCFAFSRFCSPARVRLAPGAFAFKGARRACLGLAGSPNGAGRGARYAAFAALSNPSANHSPLPAPRPACCVFHLRLHWFCVRLLCFFVLLLCFLVLLLCFFAPVLRFLRWLRNGPALVVVGRRLACGLVWAPRWRVRMWAFVSSARLDPRRAGGARLRLCCGLFVLLLCSVVLLLCLYSRFRFAFAWLKRLRRLGFKMLGACLERGALSCAMSTRSHQRLHWDFLCGRAPCA